MQDSHFPHLLPAFYPDMVTDPQPMVACSAGQNTGGWNTASRMDTLRKVFEGADAAPASLLSSCVISLLGVDSYAGSVQCVSGCVEWWRDDNEGFTRQLQNLLRGGRPAA